MKIPSTILKEIKSAVKLMPVPALYPMNHERRMKHLYLKNAKLGGESEGIEAVKNYIIKLSENYVEK